jgi:polar amino acid transport system substrate-binding protein
LRPPQSCAPRSTSRYLAAFVEDMKASGFVAAALARHGIEGAAVAPAAGRT